MFGSPTGKISQQVIHRILHGLNTGRVVMAAVKTDLGVHTAGSVQHQYQVDALANQTTTPFIAHQNVITTPCHNGSGICRRDETG